MPRPRLTLLLIIVHENERLCDRKILILTPLDLFVRTKVTCINTYLRVCAVVTLGFYYHSNLIFVLRTLLNGLLTHKL